MSMSKERLEMYKSVSERARKFSKRYSERRDTPEKRVARQQEYQAIQESTRMAESAANLRSFSNPTRYCGLVR